MKHKTVLLNIHTENNHMPLLTNTGNKTKYVTKNIKIMFSDFIINGICLWNPKKFSMEP